MRLNEYGWVVAECWEWLDRQYQHVDLDGRVVMPDHLHGVIMIDDVVGAVREPPLPISTKQINILRGMSGTPVWQRNYYEHVIRAEDELDRIRRYEDNPGMWEMDQENPAAQKTKGKESWQV